MTEKLCLAVGEWTARGEKFVALSPHDGSVVGEALRPSSDVIEAAVAGASEAFPRLKGMTTRERAEILMRASALIRDRGGELARLIALEAGKPCIVDPSVKTAFFLI